jgi:hypothetical protein
MYSLSGRRWVSNSFPMPTMQKSTSQGWTTHFSVVPLHIEPRNLLIDTVPNEMSTYSWIPFIGEHWRVRYVTMNYLLTKLAWSDRRRRGLNAQGNAYSTVNPSTVNAWDLMTWPFDNRTRPIKCWCVQIVSLFLKMYSLYGWPWMSNLFPVPSMQKSTSQGWTTHLSVSQYFICWASAVILSLPVLMKCVHITRPHSFENIDIQVTWRYSTFPLSQRGLTIDGGVRMLQMSWEWMHSWSVDCQHLRLNNQAKC